MRMRRYPTLPASLSLVVLLAAGACAGRAVTPAPTVSAPAPTVSAPAPAPAQPAPAPPAQPARTTFRAMTFNIHHGEGTDARIDLDRIAALITAEEADLVALQEVDRGVERTSRRDLPAELAALTGMTAVFSSNDPHQGGEYGNAVLTRFPVRRWANTHLRMLRAGEQRGVLQVVVDAHGRDLLFLATHIDYRPDDAERLLNVEQFREVLAQYEGLPVLFGGDFNDTPGSRTYAALSALFDDVWVAAGEGDGFTIPSREPTRRIDYLWVRKGSPLRPLRAWVPRSDASDHLPLAAEFEFKREQEVGSTATR